MAQAKQEAAEKDNMAEPQAAEPTAPEAGEEWERVKVGLGEGWDWDKNPTLVGRWIGAEVVELKEAGLDGRTEATAYLFETDDGEQVFSWQSYALSQALTEVGVGDRLKIVYKGQQDIKDGKQRINRFDVFRAKAQQPLPKTDDEEAPF